MAPPPFRRLEDGDRLRLARGDIDGRDVLRSQAQLAGILAFELPASDLTGRLEADELIDHGRVGDLDEPDDDGAGVRDEGERAGPFFYVIPDRPVDQFDVHGVLPDGVEAERQEGLADLGGCIRELREERGRGHGDL